MLSFLKRKISVRENVIVGLRFHVGIGSVLWAPTELSIGNDVYVGKYCTIQCNGSIGDGVLIANNVGIVGRRDHDIREIGSYVRSAKWVGDDEGLAGDVKNVIEIDNDVWIGYGAVLLSGIKVGRGAIIAAGSVVFNDVEPYVIVSGNPAKKIAMRFTADEIQEHEALLYGK